MRNLILAILIAAGGVNAATINVIKLPEGEKFNLKAYEFEDEIYIKSSSLARVLGGRERIDFFSKTGVIKCEDYSIEYGLFSQYVRSGESVFNIYRPARFGDGAFLLPVRYLVDVFNQISPDDFAWDGKTLRISPPTYNIIGINAFQKINGVLIEIYLKEELRFDVIKTDDSWIYVTVSEGRVDSVALEKRIPVDPVYTIKTYQFDRSAQVSIRMRPKDFTFTSKLKKDPLRIQILVRGEGFVDSSLVSTDETLESFNDNEIDVIVIDPGHGGEDFGAVGPSGTKEKEVVLKIAKYLHSYLKKDERFKPVMTRQDDNFIPLSKRTALANSVGGDMFISIHANASSNKKARGIISFFLADAKTDQARAAATLENSSIRFENMEDQKQYLTDLDFTLRDMIQTEFQRESADLADIIQGKIKGTTKIKSRGVDQAGFFVLDKAYMPAVLIETAFISNKDDEKLLKKDDFHKKTAKAIFESIVAFKEKYDVLKASSN
jgi:N-acetylmuramoyl-L-alanine amidase